MKQRMKFVWLAVLIVLLFFVAVRGYDYLSDRYSPEEKKDNSSPTKGEMNTAPDFSVIDMAGKAVKLSDFFGKPIILNFWATWCGPCEAELPSFEAAYQEHGDLINFLFVNLTDGSRDTVEGVKNYISDKRFSFPVYFDTLYSGAQAYSVQSIPITVIIDANGKLVDTHTGYMSENKLNGYIKDLYRSQIRK